MTNKEHVLAQIATALGAYYEKPAPDFRLGVDLIRVAEPHFNATEILAVVDALLEGWLGASWRVDLLEKTLANFLGVSGVNVTSSGSGANLLAVTSACNFYDWRPGDEIAIGGLTFPTAVSALLINNLIPVFLDSQLKTYTIDLDQLEQALSPRLKGIFVVHTLGNPADMAAVMEFATNHRLIVIEDVCDGLGAKLRGQHLGSFGQLATCSFYAAHHITTGEGGAVAYNDSELGTLLRSLREWGRCNLNCLEEGYPDCATQERFKPDPDPYLNLYDKKFTYENIGFNFKLTEFQAALGLVQFNRLNEILEVRRRNFAYLSDGLSNYEDFFVLPASPAMSMPAWLMLPIFVNSRAPFSRNDIVNWLEEHKIETRPVLSGNVLRQPAYRNVRCRIAGNLSRTDEIMQRGFCIGIHPKLDKRKLDFVLEVMATFLKRFL